MSIDQEIDRLYQLPLSEFIAERNALAKRAGGEAARVKALDKPSAAAWAVNQLYWRERRLYDDVVKMTTRARAAHRQSLTGKKADVPLAEAAQAAALKTAADRAEALLTQAGDPATDATMAGVRETLKAIPADYRGRLARPLQAVVGFDALRDLLRGAIGQSSRKADVVPFAAPKSSQEKARVQMEAERAKQEAAAALERIASKIRAGESALATAAKTLATAEQDRRDLDAQIEKADASIARHRAEVARLEHELKSLARDRRQIAGD